MQPMPSSLLALIDDIATLLDDVAVMTKVATKKTAGVLGDDLALNAQQVAGVNAERELPVVWAVAKGSLMNKAILVPAALAHQRACSRWPIIPLLMVGGAFLCFEGVEKLAHKFLHGTDEDAAHHDELLEAVADEKVDLVAFEKDKIKGAIRTDFILSAEIIVITLGTVAAAAVDRAGRRAGRHRADHDRRRVRPGGRHRQARRRRAVPEPRKAAARTARRSAAASWSPRPGLMKTLSVVGTAAMFLVGGGIITHNVPFLHHAIANIAQGEGVLPTLVSLLADGVLGILVGIMALAAVTLVGRIVRSKRKAA